MVTLACHVLGILLLILWRKGIHLTMAVTLSNLQKQVIRLSTLGCSLNEIARIVNLTPSEAINCKTRAMEQLGVNKVALLTRMALQQRITSMTDQLTPAEKALCENRPPTGSRLRHMLTSKLSQKEAQVVRLISLGCTQQEAAAILKVAPSAVSTRKTRAMAKLDANKVAVLVRLAIKLRITSTKEKLTPAEKRKSGRKDDGWN